MTRTNCMVVVTIAMMAAACGGADDDAAQSKPPAASQPALDPALGDVTDYTLTLDKIDKLHQAQINIGLAVKNMSTQEREAIRTASGPDATIGEMVANIESQKPYNDAIRAAGLSAREYTMIMLAMMQASMAHSVLQMRPNENQDSLAREMKVNPENIRFMRENQAEIGRRQEAVAAEMKRLGISEEG